MNSNYMFHKHYGKTFSSMEYETITTKCDKCEFVYLLI